MTRPGAISIVTAIFLAGVAVGLLGAQLFPDIGRHLHESMGVLFHGKGHDHGHGQAHGPLALDDSRHVDVLADRLGLDEQQKSRVAEIFRDARRKSASLHEEFEPAVHEHIRQTRERVAKILTPEQMETLDALTEQHRGDLERMFLTPGVP